MLDLLKKILGKTLHPRWALLFLFAISLMLSGATCTEEVQLDMDTFEDGINITKEFTWDVRILSSPRSIVEEGSASRFTVEFVVRKPNAGTLKGELAFRWKVELLNPYSASPKDFPGDSLPNGSARRTFDLRLWNHLTDPLSHTVRTGIRIPTFDDISLEGNEVFMVRIFDAKIIESTYKRYRIYDKRWEEAKSQENQIKIDENERQARGTIVDDEGIDMFIEPLDGQKKEGDSGGNDFTFKAELSRKPPHRVFVEWSVSGSGAKPADANDFDGSAFPAGKVAFNPDETLKNIPVKVSGDTDEEDDETFTVTLSNPSKGLEIDANRASAGGTILNDDEPVVLMRPPAEDESVVPPPVLKDISASLLRVVPLSGVSPFEFNSLQDALTVGEALTVVGPTGIVDNDAVNTTLIEIRIDVSATNTISALVDGAGSNYTAIFLLGADIIGDPGTIFDSSGSPFTLISPSNGSAIAMGTTSVIVQRTADSVFFKITFNMVSSGPDSNMTLNSFSGYNCGSSQTNCP